MGSAYKTPGSNLADEHDLKKIEYGGFWIRLLASVIDLIWLLYPVLIIGWLMNRSEYFEPYVINFFTSYILPFVIIMPFWFYKSSTPGKMALGLKIVDAKTIDKATKARLVLRYFAYYISFIPLCLGFLWVAWSKKKQGWHDKIANTVVIKNT